MVTVTIYERTQQQERVPPLLVSFTIKRKPLTLIDSLFSNLSSFNTHEQLYEFLTLCDRYWGHSFSSFSQNFAIRRTIWNTHIKFQKTGSGNGNLGHWMVALVCVNFLMTRVQIESENIHIANNARAFVPTKFPSQFLKQLESFLTIVKTQDRKY